MCVVVLLFVIPRVCVSRVAACLLIGWCCSLCMGCLALLVIACSLFVVRCLLYVVVAGCSLCVVVVYWLLFGVLGG